jgi:hypothetical protein
MPAHRINRAAFSSNQPRTATHAIEAASPMPIAKRAQICAKRARKKPIGGPLVLRHASKRSSGTWGPDDWDVRSALAADHYGRGDRAASAVARFLRHSGRGQGEVRRDVARVVGASWVIPIMQVV